MISKLRMSMLFTGLVLPAILAVSGCSSAHKEDAFTQEMKQKFAAMNDPRSSIEKSRQYAVEKLSDASDAEIDLLNNAAPVISHNYDESEYSFTWKGKKGEDNIEVLATPPPCEPIAVFRVNRTYYP
jgi:hypothetical protein